MRYLSDDGQVFNTQQECYENENVIKKIKIQQDEFMKQQKERYDSICKHHKDLMDEIHTYENDYKSNVFSGIYYSGLAKFISELSRTLG